MNKRKSRWKRGIGATLAAILLLAVPTSAKADVYWPEGPSIKTPSAIVIEVNSGAVLYEKNSDEVNYPASITKILTTLLALENCSLDEVVTFSDDAIRYNQGNTSHIARDYGEQMTMKECLYAVMLESANECAYAVAEHVGEKLGGNYQTFIDLMNERAKALGCTNTNFTNANGLPDDNHWTSARDMALISAEAYKNEMFRIIIGTRSYKIPPTNKHKDITPLNNHHNMVSNYKTTKYLYEYCTGGKTGYTSVAGSTLVSYAEKDGLTLVCVVMHTTGEYQYTETKSLFEHCFKSFQTVSIGDLNTEETKDSGIMNGYEAFVKPDENACVVLPITADISDVDMELVTKDLPSGVVAQMNYVYGGHVAGRVDVILSNAEVDENYFENQRPTNTNVVVIKSSSILMGLGIIVLVAALIFAGKLLYDNYYVILHQIQVKKERKSRFRQTSTKKKKWRKKDRMFKQSKIEKTKYKKTKDKKIDNIYRKHVVDFCFYDMSIFDLNCQTIQENQELTLIFRIDQKAI